MCRSRKMLKNAYLDAKIGFDTEENEPSKVLYFIVSFNPAQGFNFPMVFPPAQIIMAQAQLHQI